MTSNRDADLARRAGQAMFAANRAATSVERERLRAEAYALLAEADRSRAPQGVPELGAPA